MTPPSSTRLFRGTPDRSFVAGAVRVVVTAGKEASPVIACSDPALRPPRAINAPTRPRMLIPEGPAGLGVAQPRPHPGDERAPPRPPHRTLGSRGRMPTLLEARPTAVGIPFDTRTREPLGHGARASGRPGARPLEPQLNAPASRAPLRNQQALPWQRDETRPRYRPSGHRSPTMTAYGPCALEVGVSVPSIGSITTVSSDSRSRNQRSTAGRVLFGLQPSHVGKASRGLEQDRLLYTRCPPRSAPAWLTALLVRPFGWLVTRPSSERASAAARRTAGDTTAHERGEIRDGLHRSKRVAPPIASGNRAVRKKYKRGALQHPSAMREFPSSPDSECTEAPTREVPNGTKRIARFARLFEPQRFRRFARRLAAPRHAPEAGDRALSCSRSCSRSSGTCSRRRCGS